MHALRNLFALTLVLLPAGSLAGTPATTPASTPASTPAAETRCGWYYNPTPNNLSLADHDSEWDLVRQGGFGEELPDGTLSFENYVGPDGEDNLPAFKRVKKFWHATSDNGSYGYGCACLTGTFDFKLNRATRIDSGRAFPLARCQADKTLPKP